jgi:hypothetical protein
MAETAWMMVADYPVRPAEEDLLSFFGVPPDPVSQLDENISRKRRYWHKAAQTAPPEGRRRAEAIKEAIREASNALKRGGEASGGSTTTDGSVDPSILHDPKTVEELWRVIQRLIFRQRYDEAVDCAARAEKKWPSSVEPVVAFAWAVQMAIAQESTSVSGAATIKAIQGLEKVISSGGDAREYRIIAGLLDATGRTQEALARLNDAGRVLVPFPADMLGLRVTLLARSGDIDDAMVTAVAAVNERPSDDGIRGECVDALLQFALRSLLPVTSSEDATQYGRLVRVAAWCAKGVPDLEDRVRVHRLWAANCDQRVFAGNPALRSFVAIVSGFLLLPLYNYLRCRPSWQILNEGPIERGSAKRRKIRNFAFYQVASSPHVELAHRGARESFAWAPDPEAWPELSSLLDL